MPLEINDEAPNFTADSTQGRITFHDWIGEGWAILFSHRKDFTPVCTTELGYMAGLKEEFNKRNCKIIALSVDPVDEHNKWAKDIEEITGDAANYPMICDPELRVAELYDLLPDDLLPDDAGTTSQGRTSAQNPAVRTAFLVGPDKKIKMSLTYPMSTTLNLHDMLRVLDSIQLMAKQQVAEPVNDDLIIVPMDADENAQEKGFWNWLHELFGRSEKRL